jgi:bifunctional non-homologous end joining protein LigD
VKRLPTGDAWLHEPKLDGWRLQAVKRGKDVALYSRNGCDLTDRYDMIAEAVQKLPCRSCVLDGELLMADEGGINFYGLRGAGRHDDVSLWAFDLLELNGKDMRSLPLIDRKARLEKLMRRSKHPALRMIPSFNNGEALLIACMDRGLEGVVSKRRNAPYRSGSRPEWTKIKCPGWTAQNRDRWEKLRG